MEKKNKKYIVIIIIFALALLATTSYIVYDKVFSKENKEVKQEERKPQEETPNEQKESITEAEKELLENQISDYTTYFAGYYPITNISSLDNQDVLYFAMMKSGKIGEDIMESDLEKILDQYFGKNHPFKHSDIMCPIDDEPLYIYDSARREYYFEDTHPHGGSGVYRGITYETEGEKIDNKYIVRTKILYNDYCSGMCPPRINYYITKDDSKNSENPILGTYDEDHEITEEEYNSIKDSIPITTYTFIKDENNNYGLKQVNIK